MSQTGTALDRWMEDIEPDDDPTELHRPFWRRPGLIVSLLVVLIVAVGGGLYVRGRVTSSTPVQYKFGTVTTGDLTVTTSATGPIGSSAIYNLNFPTSGKLIELDVSVGQQVQAGQLLAKIDLTALNDAVNQAQTSLDNAWISFNNAVTNRDDVKAQNDPCPTTATPPSAAKTQAQCTQAIDQAQAQVNTTWGQVQTAQAQLQTAQDNLKNGGLTAPAAGTIISINSAVGTTVGGSSAFIVLEDLNQLSVTAQVNEADIGNVKVGQSVSFSVPAYPSATFHGTVTAISLVGQTTSNVVTYNATVSVDNGSLKGAQLLPGMTATLRITTAQRIGVVLVPNTAISFARSLLTSGQLDRTTIRNLLASATQANNGQVPQGTASFVAELQNGKLTPKLIFTGLSDSSSTEVISGLNADEQVLIGQIGGTPTTTTSGGGGTGGGGIFGGGGGGGGGRGGNGP